MQIIKLWIKISTLLAIIGWIVHAFIGTEGIAQPPVSTSLEQPAIPAENHKFND